MKLNTVNVLEIVNGTPEWIVSFKDNSEGNKQAERLFKKRAKENKATDKDMDSYLEDGSYLYAGDYGVYIIHS